MFLIHFFVSIGYSEFLFSSFFPFTHSFIHSFTYWLVHCTGLFLIQTKRVTITTIIFIFCWLKTVKCKTWNIFRSKLINNYKHSVLYDQQSYSTKCTDSWSLWMLVVWQLVLMTVGCMTVSPCDCWLYDSWSLWLLVVRQLVLMTVGCTIVGPCDSWLYDRWSLWLLVVRHLVLMNVGCMTVGPYDCWLHDS